MLSPFHARLAAQENEKILKPHIALLVRACIRNVSATSAPYQQLFVLRQLFRSVGRLNIDSPLFDEFASLFPYIIEVRV